MSIPGPALFLSVAQGGGLAFLQSLLGRGVMRQITWTETVYFEDGRPAPAVLGQANSMVPQIVIDERHQDSLTITDHPVEQGAVISDHAYKNPAVVVVHFGWSTAGGITTGTSLANLPANLTLLPKFGDPNVLRATYDRLLRLQADRQLVNLMTGKRYYTSMLLQNIGLETTRKTENSLDIVCMFRQVVIARTQIVAVPAKEVQQTPQKTAPQQNGGTKQLLPGGSFTPPVAL